MKERAACQIQRPARILGEHLLDRRRMHHGIVLTNRWPLTRIGHLHWDGHAWQTSERRAQNLVLLDNALYRVGENGLVHCPFDEDTALRHELAAGVRPQQTPQSPLLWRQPITGHVELV
jgi:hypothetical protein